MNKGTIQSEISTWEFLASTLTQDHQQGVKREIERKVRDMKHELIKVCCVHPANYLKDYHDMSILCTKCHEVIYQSFNGELLASKRKELGM